MLLAAHMHYMKLTSLQWRHNEYDGVSNHRRMDCLVNLLLRHRSKKISKLRVTGLCVGNSPVTGEFPTQRTSNAENVSIWWRHHGHMSFNMYMVNVNIECLFNSIFKLTTRKKHQRKQQNSALLAPVLSQRAQALLVVFWINTIFA